MENRILYKKSQIGYAIPVITGLVIVASYLSPGQGDMSKLILTSILFVVGVMFYKLTIVIDNEKIYAYFGYNLFKRTLYFRDMDFDSITVEKIHWYTGIGIRLTPKGWLYNVAFGRAVRVTSAEGKVFFAGSKEPEAVKAKLLEIRDSFKR